MTVELAPDTQHSARAFTPFQGFRSDVEGLRGLAVALVVVSHVGVGFHNGFIGVDIFFAISGFLITGLMLREYEQSRAQSGVGSISLRSFYARRARRIIPAALLCLLLTVLGASILMNSVAAGAVRLDALWASVFLANLDLINSSTDYFQQGFDASPLQNFWSLAVEEQFYLVWPTLVILAIALHGARVGRTRLDWLSRVVALIAIMTVVSFCWSVWSSMAEPSVAYFSTFTRAWELGAGAFAAAMMFKFRATLPSWLGIVGLAAIIATLIFMPADAPFPGWIAAIPVLGTVLLLSSGAQRQGVAYRILSFAPLRLVGLVSYSLYLFHWPIIVLFGRFMDDWNQWLRVAVLIGASVVVAIASYLWVEKPALKYLPKFSFEQHRPTRSPALIPRVAAIGTSLALAVGATLVFVPTALAQTPYVQAIAAADEARGTETTPAFPVLGTLDQEETAAPTDAELAQLADAWKKTVAESSATGVPDNMKPSLQVLAERRGNQPDLCPDRECAAGSGPLRAVLVGNSFADMMWPMVRDALDPNQWDVTVRWRSGCQLGDVASCPEVFDIADEQVDLLIISDFAYIDGQKGIDRDTRDRQMAEQLARYAAQVPRVVYLGEVPGMERALIDCVDQAMQFAAGCTSDRSRVAPINAFKSDLARSVGATFVDPTDWICAESTCPVVIGGAPTYVDTQHLEASVSSSLAPAFALSIRSLTDEAESK